MRKEKCSTYYSSVKENNLITFDSKIFLETLLAAAQKRGHEEILKLVEKLEDAEVPSLTYHKTCQPMFVLKRNLEKT